MPRRFAVIMAADVADGTPMMSEDKEATIDLIGAQRDVSLGPIANRHSGAVPERMGGGWIAAFRSVFIAATSAAGTVDSRPPPGDNRSGTNALTARPRPGAVRSRSEREAHHEAPADRRARRT